MVQSAEKKHVYQHYKGATRKGILNMAALRHSASSDY